MASETRSVEPSRKPHRLSVFGAEGPVTMDEIPSGRFKDRLNRLSPPARQRVLAQLGRLRVPVNNVGSLSVEDDGTLFYECAPPRAGEAPVAVTGLVDLSPASVPIASPPVRHSRLGSANVIYLDFNGDNITGTNWNKSKGSPEDSDYRPAVTTYVAKPFDTDGDATAFNDAEQAAIVEIWRRVAEDYAGFDVDVTTERPATLTATTGRVLITAHVDANGVNMPSRNAGGVAYIDVFGREDYATVRSPAFVYFDNLSSNARYIAEACSHEMGHNLSLSHDGTSTEEYYRGHGSGETSWAPIMGGSYYTNLTQWSKGEYYDANNPQDDLALIAGHLSYAPDDNTTSSSLNDTEFYLNGEGVIGAPGDEDWFTLTVPSRAMHLEVTPPRAGGSNAGNLDVKVALYDETGNLVAEDNAAASAYTLSAVLDAGLAAGTYRLKVSPSGWGDPLRADYPSGYTAYGSLGQYAITGTLSLPVAPIITQSPANVQSRAGETATYYVYFTGGNPPAQLQWQRQAAGTETWVNLDDDATYGGTRTGTLQVKAVSLAMSGTAFRCRAYNMAGEIYSAIATLTVSPAIAPQIYGMPSLVPVEYGNSFSLYPSISGTFPMTFVWTKNGTVIPEATSSNYGKSNVTDADTGLYVVTATNQAGTSTSSGAQVTVAAPKAPAIYNLPQNLTAEYGSSFYISPSISGTQPITYIWRKDGVAIANATSSTFNSSGVTAATAGSYTLVATNAWGAVTSSVVNVSVTAPVAPTIYGLPTSVTVEASNSLYLSATISGTTPVTIQWYKDGQLITGANYSSYSRSTMTASDAGSYTLVASNSVGTVTSNPVSVSVNAARAPEIAGQPSPVTVEYGSYISLYVSVNGSGPLTYQWRKDGEIITGETSNWFSRSNTTTADSGIYTFTVSNPVGSVTTAGIPVTVLPATAPSVYGLPRTLVVAYGSSLYLSPNVRGTFPITYQWEKDGVALSGATASNYSVNPVAAGHAGNYKVKATNAWGTTTSSTVTVIVDEAAAPAIYGLPASVTVAYGEGVSFSPAITGTMPIAYQWMRDGMELANGKSAYFSKSGLTSDDAGSYTLMATNDWGSVTSLPVTVTVQPAIAPRIVGMPQSLTPAYGTSFSIYPGVYGSSPMTFQWSKDGVAIVGATSNSYSLSTAATTHSGVYTLKATNVAGETISSSTTVTVQAGLAPSIGPLGAASNMAYGTSLSMYPSVLGTSPLTYQWSKDGVALANGYSQSYSKSYVTTDDSGSYTLTVTNAFGTATSTSRQVTVDPPLPPVVYGLPANIARNYGDSFSVYPGIAGTGPITHQWRKNGVTFSTSTYSGDLYKYNLTPTDSGTYTLVATNAWGTATSTPINVVVAEAQPPAVYNVPSALTLAYGDYLSLSMTVTGTGPLTYQWSKDGQPLASATSSSFYRNVTTADSGSYTLTVTNMAGSVTSAAIPVTVRAPIPPSITNQPQSLSLRLGFTATFTVTATGSPALSYQWYRNGNPIVDATYGNLSISNVKTADFGEYHVVVTNPAGNVESNHVTLGADTGFPVIAAATRSNSSFWIRADHTLWGTGGNTHGVLGDGTTASRTNARLVSRDVRAVAVGANFALYIKIDGTLWAMGNNSAGQLGTGTVLTSLVPVQIAADVAQVAAGYQSTYFIKTNGSLWSVGNNDYGQLGDGGQYSRSIPIQIATEVTAVAAGDTHALFIKTDGSLWGMGANGNGQLGDAATGSKTTPIQIAREVTAVAAGSYHSAFRRYDGTLWTMGSNYSGQLGDGTTTGRSTPVQVVADVVSIAAGAENTFYVTADHQLRAMGSNSSGQLGPAVTTSYQLTPLTILTDVVHVSLNGDTRLHIDRNGLLFGWCRNYYGELGNGQSYNYGSLSAPLQMTEVGEFSPIVMAAPQSAVVERDAKAAFGIKAIGKPAPAYQWQRRAAGGEWEAIADGAIYAGAATALLTIAPVGPTMDGDQFRCVVTNAGGSATSAAASMIVPRNLPVITLQPLSQTVAAGSAVTLTVGVADPAGLSYQWYREGTEISGATSASYSVAVVGASQAGSYTVVVSNADGPVTSDPATLTVNRLAQTVTFAALADRAFTTNAITLTASASSNLPVSYAIVTGEATVTGNQLKLTGSGLVAVAAAQMGDEIYAPAVTIQRSFIVTDSLDAWSQEYFDANELADITISGAAADPDRDGLANLMEYALGLNPRHIDTNGLPEVSASSSQWVYTYARPEDRSDLTYVVESSTDLTHWSVDSVTLIKIGTAAGMETWQATLPLNSATNVYFRLKVEKN